MDLLVDAWNAREDRRPHLRKRLDDRIRVGTEGERVADVRAEQMHEATEVVCEWQVQQHHVVRDGEVLDLPSLVRHLVVVAVADHAGLRRTGRSRRVDEREEVVLLDRSGSFDDGGGMQRRVFAAACSQIFEVGEREDVCELDSLHLRPLLVVFAEHADGIRVLEHVRAVLGGAVHVDRRADRADEPEGEVEERPFEARRGEDRERVAFTNA